MSDLRRVPDSDEWYRMGLALHANRRWGCAAGCFARVDAGDYRGLANLGWNRHMSARSADAIEPLLAAQRLAPEDGLVSTLLGQVYLALGEDGLALEWARRGVEGSGESPIAHVSLAFALFFSGLWEEGWREYEWRFQYRADQYPMRAAPLWRGEVVDRLWVEAEQGLGDTIFGLRWLDEAARRVGRVSFFVQPELYAWIRGEVDNPEVEVLPLPRPVPDADAWCPLLSLPAAMGVGGPEVINRPYVLFKPRRIGICWRGNPAHEQAHHRDIPLPYWLPLTENAGVELQSLQVGGTSELSEMGAMPLIWDRAPEITNFADTAKVLGELDLLLTVDTAVAHLAGALGVPTWLLINQRGQDFRWGRGEWTPWYPSLRLVRRGLHEDWAAVMRRVDAELRG